MSLIVDETNRYAEQVLHGTNKVWTTDAAEIRAYMGFMILMGINHLPKIRDYWSVNPYFRYALVVDRITHDRFEEITRYLHFIDNDSLPSRGEEGYSRLQKVDPVITALKNNFQSYYPHCEVSIGEAMIPFKGPSTMKQYVLLKPVKRGFMWAMADAVNGYMYDFDVYTGAKGDRDMGLGEKVVLTLAESIKERHHQLYFDNFFTSISLLSKLLAQGTYGCGTIRTNRKHYPYEISVEAQRFKRGESTFRQCGNIVATAWKDNKVVNVASTLANPMDITSVNSRQIDGTRVPFTCPKCVELYNEHMGGVDEGNQLRGYYHVRLKCTKKYKYIFWFMYDVGVTYTFILHPKFDVTTGTPTTRKQLRVKLAEHAHWGLL